MASENGSQDRPRPDSRGAYRRHARRGIALRPLFVSFRPDSVLAPRPRGSARDPDWALVGREQTGDSYIGLPVLSVQSLAPAEPRGRGGNGSRTAWPKAYSSNALGRKMGALKSRWREPAASFCQLVWREQGASTKPEGRKKRKKVGTAGGSPADGYGRAELWFAGGAQPNGVCLLLVSNSRGLLPRPCTAANN